MLVAIISLSVVCIIETAVLGLLAFKSMGSAKTATSAASTVSPTTSHFSEEEIAKERHRFEQEMEAFQELMSYNADMAYGIDK